MLVRGQLRFQSRNTLVLQVLFKFSIAASTYIHFNRFFNRRKPNIILILPKENDESQGDFNFYKHEGVNLNLLRS